MRIHKVTQGDMQRQLSYVGSYRKCRGSKAAKESLIGNS